jgi:hypothetical protein
VTDPVQPANRYVPPLPEEIHKDPPSRAQSSVPARQRALCALTNAVPE